MFVFLAIVISSGGGEAGWVHVWLPVQAVAMVLFFVLLENPLVPIRSSKAKRGAFCLSSLVPVGLEKPIPFTNRD
jgi:putative effector of murein hydrolase LrgA (UPF0299 family)